MTITANFDTDTHRAKITQTIKYQNKSNQKLDTIYLNDWNHSYSSKKTPLANRFAEEFKNNFHFSKPKDKGYTVINSIKQDNQTVSYTRLKTQPDVIKIPLNNTLKPNEVYTLNLEYDIQIPYDKFTRYGVTNQGEYNLRFWYISPAVYDGNWHYYSNKDLNDLYVDTSNISLNITYPNSFTPITELNKIDHNVNEATTTTTFKGKNRNNSKLSLIKNNDYNIVETDFFDIQTNIYTDDLPKTNAALISDKVAQFITNNLGEYPHKKMVLSLIDYKKSPIYGLNQLPDFIRPFEDSFQHEIKLLKTALKVYLDNTLLIHPRKDQWLADGIQTYYLMKYVKQFYPNQKILGKLSNVFGVRLFHAADLNFNDQYSFLHMHMARVNLDQPIGMAKDSLLKFNKNITNKYKAAIGLNYLKDYIGNNTVDQALTQYLKEYLLKKTTPKTFETLIKSKTNKDLNWFFDEFVNTSKKIDYKFKKIVKTEDSIKITLKNLRDNRMPISLFTLKNDTVSSKQWIKGFKNTKTITIANKDVDRLALNHDFIVPEFNQRNNYKKINGTFLNNKPFQFRLFKDIEDPTYNQVYFMPEFDYNFYDGITPGMKFYNNTLLKKRLLYRISPKYGFKSKQLVGSGSLIYTARPENSDRFKTRFGLSTEYFNYAPELTYTSFTPFISFTFRDHKDLRDNKRKHLSFRYINIDREVDPTGEFKTEGEPKYAVFNASCGIIDNKLKDLYAAFADVQFAKNFGKISTTLEFRYLNERNKQFNLRAFSGLFLYNDTYKNTDFFSFALDRPTDYLFDYSYLGRSENTGLLSQQLIIAEGGFKSKLSTPFANQWLTTINASTTLWKYIMLYGDVGIVKNHGFNPKTVYDSGVRLNLVEDYFELYFPVYSNLGWEIGQPNYQEKIRFIVTLSPKTLLGLFTRRWY